MFQLQYSRLIYRCIGQVLGRFATLLSPEDVREVYGLLHVQLLANNKRRLRSFEAGRSNRLSSWIGMLAIHSAYDYLRALRKEPPRLRLSAARTVGTEAPDPYEDYLMQERARVVTAMLNELSAKDQKFVALYYGEGLDPEQVAQRMDISIKTVYSKKHKIQTRLETLLSQQQLAA
jgi:RNA polymerase sigma-70 factor (ECF subfamily)